MIENKYSYLIGTKINSLQIEKIERTEKGKLRVVCACDCGIVKTYCLYHVLNSRIKSCGCFKKKMMQTHGKSKLLAYSTWEKIIDRCHNKNSTTYKFYGAKGITVCDRWRKAENFILDMGDRPTEAHTIDRIDNYLGYSPDNCRWATISQQANNKKTTVRISINGVEKTPADWSRYLGVHYHTVNYLRKKGELEKFIVEKLAHLPTPQGGK